MQFCFALHHYTVCFWQLVGKMDGRLGSIISAAAGLTEPKQPEYAPSGAAFIASASWQGAKPGYIFSTGPKGTGWVHARMGTVCTWRMGTDALLCHSQWAHQCWVWHLALHSRVKHLRCALRMLHKQHSTGVAPRVPPASLFTVLYHLRLAAWLLACALAGILHT